MHSDSSRAVRAQLPVVLADIREGVSLGGKGGLCFWCSSFREVLVLPRARLCTWRQGPAAVPRLCAVPSAFTPVLQGVQAPNDRSCCRHSLTPRGRGYCSSKVTATFWWMASEMASG